MTALAKAPAWLCWSTVGFSCWGLAPVPAPRACMYLLSLSMPPSLIQISRKHLKVYREQEEHQRQ